MIEVVKLVNTDINDGQFNQLLNFLLNSQVTTLVLPGNNLNEISLDALLHFVCENGFLKKVYISKNNINILKGKAKAKIVLLKEKGLTMYV